MAAGGAEEDVDHRPWAAAGRTAAAAPVLAVVVVAVPVAASFSVNPLRVARRIRRRRC